MIVDVPAEYFRRIDPMVLVQRHQELHRRAQRLQDVHIVRERYALLRLGGRVIIPSGTSEGRTWQQSLVGVKNDIVVLVRKRAEQFILGAERFLQHAQCLVAVAGKDHVVEPARVAATAPHGHSIGLSHHACNRRTQQNAIEKGCRQLANIFA
jgi:hypothetical protein